MTSLLRFLGSVLLALLIVVVVIGVLAVAWPAVMSASWEYAGLDSGVTDGQWLWVDEQPYFCREWQPRGMHTVVLLHGFQVEGSETWLPLAEELAGADYHVLAIDMRGFGHSNRDGEDGYSLEQHALDVARVLNEKYVQDATLVGYGYGGRVALELAADQPQFVKRLVLIAPELSRPADSAWINLLPLPRLQRGVIWLTECGGPLWRAGQRRGFYDEAAIPEGYWDRVTQPTHVVGSLDALLAMHQSSRVAPLSAADVREVEIPVLLMVGAFDERVSPSKVEELAGQLPGASYEMVPEAGHYVHIEEVGRVRALITAFIARSTD